MLLSHNTIVCQITNARRKDKDLNLVGLPILVENIVDLQGSSAAAGVRYCPTDKVISHFAEGNTGDPLKPATGPCLLCCALHGSAWAGSSGCQGDAYPTKKTSCQIT